jgi:hypothetical protein
MNQFLNFGAVMGVCNLLLSGCNFVLPDTPRISEEPPYAETLISTPALASPISTNLPTPSNVPKLDPTEAVDLVFDLVRTNGNCDFPCFLGAFVPGETSQAAVNDFISQFEDYSSEEINIAVNIFSSGKNRTDLLVTRDYDDFYIALIIQFEFQNDLLTQIAFDAWPAIRSGEKRGEFLFGIPEYDVATEFYSLPTVLSEYGMPANVLIGTFNRGALQGPYIPFSIVLHYPDHGLLIEYIAQQKENGTLFLGCPGESMNFELFISGPEANYGIADYLQYYEGELLSDIWLEAYRPVEEATSLSLEDFYDLYSNSRASQCLETPISLWP